MNLNAVAGIEIVEGVVDALGDCRGRASQNHQSGSEGDCFHLGMGVEEGSLKLVVDRFTVGLDNSRSV